MGYLEGQLGHTGRGHGVSLRAARVWLRHQKFLSYHSGSVSGESFSLATFCLVLTQPPSALRGRSAVSSSSKDPVPCDQGPSLWPRHFS